MNETLLPGMALRMRIRATPILATPVKVQAPHGKSGVDHRLATVVVANIEILDDDTDRGFDPIFY